MSDLFCPATLIVARHGEATYDEPDVTSNDGGWLTPLGRRQAAALATDLADRRVAAIWCSDMSRAVQTAEIAAAVLDVPVRVRAGLREASWGSFLGQPDVDALFDDLFLRWLDGDLRCRPAGGRVGRRHRAADDRRARVDGRPVPRRDGPGGQPWRGDQPDRAETCAERRRSDFARGRLPTNCGTCEVTADADGWLLHSWGGEPVAVSGT